MQRIALVLVAAGLTGQVMAQENALQLPSCENKCYKQTAEIKGCGETDYACACNGFKENFYPQFSSCLIEGCAFHNAGISQQELESRVCKAAGQNPPSSSSSAPSSGGETTPAPTSSNAGATTTTTAPGSASSSLVSSSTVSNDVPPSGNPSVPEDTATASSPTSANDNASPGQLLQQGLTWVWQMTFAAMIVAAG